ncbi:MAG TPA: radical SAM protein [bacterium]|uniref:Cyclic pyranopterin monophosphate synthase n=1 Tax=candidate division TA06 bacterium ADurb.Bin417 TaxID=1852828 RepID=A0A1V5MGY0_UNCT6|nr:MAG: Cyclic pyranopterin monophosphate synthase [candidate division TA06 bacterium ADurb.Bin417]HNQ35847.1 radical SAM protein [bacterium]HNS47976.1 radical SAM protein [bacterium]
MAESRREKTMDQIRIDSHKLIYHPERVAAWLAGKDIYPIYLEIGPAGSCNHRCIFCALDYLGYRKNLLETGRLKSFLGEAARKGVKSVMYAGEGEPLLHREIAGIINHTRGLGIDVALTTNGVLFKPELARECLGSLTWMKVSLDAATPETYARVHGCPPGDWRRVMENLKAAVALRAERKYAATIGVQLLLLPENCEEVAELAGQLQAIGADYLVVKPYSQHPKSGHRRPKGFNYARFQKLERELEQFQTDRFQVFFRARAMGKLNRARTYRRCLGLPFWAYLDAAGNLWACSAYLGDRDFLYGNIYQATLGEIWTGRRRREVQARVARMDTGRCREICRLDEINAYLWELKHPSAHVNFI